MSLKQVNSIFRYENIKNTGLNKIYSKSLFLTYFLTYWLSLLNKTRRGFFKSLT
jgi:hypothetical protein